VKPEEKNRHLRASWEAYSQAYQITDGYWTGINAATLGLLLGERAKAEATATRVAGQCQAELSSLGPGDGGRYWPLATLAEAYLVLGRVEKAASIYRQAVDAGEATVDQRQSTRRNARALLTHLGLDDRQLDEIFQIPRIAVFIGHMVDREGRPEPRFPLELENAVASAIAERIDDLGIGMGYASAACGSDILFHEQLRAHGGSAHVVLPYDAAQFREDSVTVAPGDWGKRFNRVLADVGAANVLTLSPQRLTLESLSYEYANRVMFGLAQYHARQLGTDLVVLAVWDGRAGDGPGGTAGMVARCRSLGYAVEQIDVGKIRAGQDPTLAHRSLAADSSSATDLEREGGDRIKAILFADVCNFSKLREEQNPLFIEHYSARVAEVLAGFHPSIKNTWGDGLFLVFDSIREAGLFALELRDAIRETDWASKDLPKDLNVRVALHAGPAYETRDPITGQANLFGAHVSRAARIEPVTYPGEVFASHAFAALAAEQKITEFRTEYVGKIPLDKKYGELSVHRVFR